MAPQNPPVHDPAPEPRQGSSRKAPGFLQWLPWEKVTIWGLFLLAIYVLRDFFFVIFMTFIVSYIMRGVIVRSMRLVTSRREVPWLERIMAVGCFLVLFAALYGVGSYLGPHLEAQVLGLVRRVKTIEPQRELWNVGVKTVGAYRFERLYGDPDNPLYQEAFQKYLEEEELEVTDDYDEFSKMEERIQEDFRARLEKLERDHVETEVSRLTGNEQAFKAWFLEEKGPEILASEREELVREWEMEALSGFLDPESVEKAKNEAGFDQRLLEWRFTQIQRDPTLLNQYRKEWITGLETEALEEWRKSPKYERERLALLRDVYVPKHALKQLVYPYTFERYLELREAFYEGAPAFEQKLVSLTGEEASPEEKERMLRENFEREKQEAFFKEWWDSDTGRQFKEYIQDNTPQLLATVRGWLVEAIPYMLSLPIQLSLALLLSFFITFDIPKLRRGVRKLKTSRVSEIYQEIAPGLASFGHLIGRAFQAQGVIAVFNTILTFIAIRLLGIQNEVFLCSIVFICSFIPVLGVVLSSIPIAVMAIIQPDGSIWLALYAILAILIIHFIETSVLNPKILGDMLHLHPVVVLAVLAVGEHFFGVWGLLLAVPVTVYIIRFVLLDEGIPGFLPAHAGAPRGGSAASPPVHPSPTPASKEDARDEEGGPQDGKARPASVASGSGKGRND